MEDQEITQAQDENLKLAQYYKAEFENFKRRNADATSKAYNDGKEVAILQILSIGDSLQEALKACSHDREGIEILIRKFSQTLTGLGVVEIPSVGEPFDPKFHDAVAGTGDTIAEEFQRGYMLGTKLLRPSLVRVG